MKNNCYWKHGTTNDLLYRCLDGENYVCARCCTENCHIETPHYFKACMEQGFPVWPKHKKTIPKKIVCLESAWSNKIFDDLSVKHFLETLKLFIAPFKISYRFIESKNHLEFCAKYPKGLLWLDQESWDVPVFYLAFHGKPGKIQSTLDLIDEKTLCDAFDGYGGYKNLFYFSSCSTFKGQVGRNLAKNLKKSSGTQALLKYTEDIDWLDSMIVDLLFLNRFFTDKNPWNNLDKIYGSVIDDFAPAKKMGFSLF